MTFTYDGTPSTVLEKVRLEIGDTDPTSALFTDEELNVWITNRADNIYLAAADACEAAARKFARAYDFTTDGQSFHRSQMTKSYMDLAKDLRQRAGGVVTVEVTKVDGYSDDIANQDVAGTANPRHYYYRVGVEDLP